MSETTLEFTALDELNSVETRTIFDAANKLSSLGVSRIANIPQIIVVGDQSSGKSSVLEAISHVNFPAQGGICTRFATELVLQPGSQCVTASVQFADSTKPPYPLQVASFDQDEIKKTIRSATENMGLSDTGCNFSKDVLRVEIQAPDIYPLTLVDLPGICDIATAPQSAEDTATVMELVKGYMKNPNNIILAIISADNQLANQAILQEALKYDPTKMRTLGVITKPDLLHPGSSDEHEYLQIIRSYPHEDAYSSGLGWHVLRNLADHEKDLGPRDTVEEQFFKSGAWGLIPKANRGVNSLRVKLSHILHDHIKRSLPAVLADIESNLRVRETKLDQLGKPRTTPEDMRAYLVDIAGNFQRLVHDGIWGHYNDPFFGGINGTHRKLRSKLRNFNQVIRHVLIAFGSAQEVVGRYGTTQQPELPGYLVGLLETYTSALPDPEVVTWAELSAQMEFQAATSQGTEFPGYTNMDIVIQLFQRQAKPWQRIAELHLEKVTNDVKVFVDEAIEHAVGPLRSTSTTAAIFSTYVDDFFDEREQLLSSKLKEILRPFKEGYVLPVDGGFPEAMENTAAERATDKTESGSDLDQKKDIIIFSQSSNDFGIKRIVDTMQNFYDVSLIFPDKQTSIYADQVFPDGVTNVHRQLNSPRNRELSDPGSS
ncbi:hypothetical protein EsH8_IV_000334 [Colletotrichum jinshuiense]